jgi:hypothetical protein
MFVKPTIRPTRSRTVERALQTGTCPTCGGLECLCRPRFFAGQLLSEEDLNRLDHYVTGKNRLHNRYLHGWGVVCGLEVVCHPCKDAVVVREGYALGPCGEDIVVCKEVQVPICDLIRQCREKERGTSECEPYPSGSANNGCEDECQDWVLFIRYDEKPSRAVTALRANGGEVCCSHCSNTTQTCGCQSYEGSSSRPVSATKAARQTPAQCEPTVICEGYRFEVAKHKPQQRARLAGSSRRVLGIRDTSPYAMGMGGSAGISTYAGIAGRPFESECIDELVGRLPPYPSNGNLGALRQWCCGIKDVLRDFFSDHGTYDCQLDEQLKAVTCPSLPSDLNDQPQVDKFQQDVNAAIESMTAIASSYLNNCLCSQFTVPCPTPEDDPRVPLAIVSICDDGCRVMSVCNLNIRRYVLSSATLQDLLYSSGIMQSLQSRLAGLCCQEERKVVPVSGFQPQGTERYRNLRYAARAFPQKAEFSNMAFRTWSASTQQVSTHSVLLGALGALDAAGKPLVADEVLRNPEQFLIASNLIRPLLDTLLPDEIASLLRPVGAKAATKAPESIPEADVVRMRTELDELRRTVTEQQTRIEELISRLDRGPE